MSDLTTLSDTRLSQISDAAALVWRVLGGFGDDEDSAGYDAALADLTAAGFKIEDEFDAADAETDIDAEIKRRKPAQVEAAWDADRYMTILEMAANRTAHVGEPATRPQIAKLAQMMAATPNYGHPFGGNVNAVLTKRAASNLINDLSR